MPVGKTTIIERIDSQHRQIQLQQRNGHYEIIYNGVFLMASYNGVAEREMVRHALTSASPGKKELILLIAGLGMGFSLEEALKDPRTTRVDVIEIEEKIIEWNRNAFGHLNNNAVRDPRVNIYQKDFRKFVDHCASRQYDILAMDIDNGPEWLARPENKFFYTPTGLLSLKELLAPGGILTIWSPEESLSFMKILNKTFGKAYIKKCRETTGQSSFYYAAINS